MYVQSQLQESALARMVHSGKRGHRIVAVIKFIFDESYDAQIMAVGGWIAEESEWRRLESRWQRHIDRENAASRPDQQITRYHASPMNSKDYEFKNWDAAKCLKFSKKLISLLSERRMGAFAVACDMEAIKQVFPKGDAEGLLRRTYTLCFKQMMVDLAITMEEIFPGDTVLLVHDSGNWDSFLLSAYNLMLKEGGWARAGLFEGLLAKTGQTSIGLQAADLIAYESFKGVKAKTKNPEAGIRGAMQEMIGQEIPLRVRWINLPAAQALYSIMKDSGKYEDLEGKGIC
jgi:hypothetical protein